MIEKEKLLDSIKSILYKDNIDLKDKIILLKSIPKDDKGIIEDIIDELLSNTNIFDFNLSKINEDNLEEWIEREKKTLRISHNTKIIENSYYGIKGCNRVVIPGSVEEISNSFCYSDIIEIEFLEPKNESENGLSDINNNSFNYSSIEKIKLPKTVNSIENSFNISSVKKLELNEEITNLKSSFNNTKLNKVDIPGTIKYIDHCFNDCNLLNEVILNEGLIEISNSFEMNCINEILFPKTILAINNSFSFNDKLNHIVLNEGLKQITSSFNYCQIKDIEIPSTVNLIEEAFSCCDDLNSIKLNDNINKINFAFNNCTIKQLKLPNNLKSLHNSFNKCCDLKILLLNNNIEEIYNSFNECDIRKVLFPESIKEIKNSFKYNEHLSTINDNLKLYLLVLAYTNKYYEESDIEPNNSSFIGTNIYNEIIEKSSYYNHSEIDKMSQYQLKKRSPFMKK